MQGMLSFAMTKNDDDLALRGFPETQIKKYIFKYKEYEFSLLNVRDVLYKINLKTFYIKHSFRKGPC